MKYLIIPYIALGFVLSTIVGIEYDCEGPEMFPIYYGSPFVFKMESLGSSMEYYYSISGLVLNVVVWSLILGLIRLAIAKIGAKIGDKRIKLAYKGVIVVLIAFTTLNIAIDSVMIGQGFKKGLNYWYMDLDKDAKDWGVTCEGRVRIFKK